MFKVTVAVVLAAALAGCGGGANYAMKHYRGVETTTFTTAEGVQYRIFDKPDEDRLMITASLGDAAGIGIARGLTFNAMDTDRPIVVYRDAAIEWLTSTGRTCRAVESFEIVVPQYEIRYACDDQSDSGEGTVSAPAAQQPS